MLSIAVRIAQRMGLHSEAVLSKSSPLEAEMCRRLWWSLVLFDTRIGEMADFQATCSLPLWDCNAPLNVNDSDLRHDMKEPPPVQGISTDAFFAVVRSELNDSVRHTEFHRGYYGGVSKREDLRRCTGTAAGEMERIAKRIEEKYLSLCDEDNPLHFMTIWTTRGQIAKFRLMEHHSLYAGTPLHQQDAQREAALSYALAMLEANTKLVTSPLTLRFSWMVNMYFPFIGYIQIVQYLKWRPVGEQASVAWQVMSENYVGSKGLLGEGLMAGGSRFFRLLSGFVMEAWEVREAAKEEGGWEMETPEIVVAIKARLAELPETNSRQTNGANLPMANVSQNISIDEDYAFSMLGSTLDGADSPGLGLPDMQMDNVNWSAMDWDMGNASIGEMDDIGGQE